MLIELPDLPVPADALEPWISAGRCRRTTASTTARTSTK